jgi:hypothetical protein
MTPLHTLLQHIPRRNLTSCLRTFDTGSSDRASHATTLRQRQATQHPCKKSADCGITRADSAAHLLEAEISDKQTIAQLEQ